MVLGQFDKAWLVEVENVLEVRLLQGPAEQPAVLPVEHGLAVGAGAGLDVDDSRGDAGVALRREDVVYPGTDSALVIVPGEPVQRLAPGAELPLHDILQR